MPDQDQPVLTLSSLIAVLRDYERQFGDMAVEVTWEGITRTLHRESVFRDREGGTLMLDADNCFYREDMRHPGEPRTTSPGWAD